jgi:hypothetical protein
MTALGRWDARLRPRARLTKFQDTSECAGVAVLSSLTAGWGPGDGRKPCFSWSVIADAIGLTVFVTPEVGLLLDVRDTRVGLSLDVAAAHIARQFSHRPQPLVHWIKKKKKKTIIVF